MLADWRVILWVADSVLKLAVQMAVRMVGKTDALMVDYWAAATAQNLADQMADLSADLMACYLVVRLAGQWAAKRAAKRVVTMAA